MSTINETTKGQNQLSYGQDIPREAHSCFKFRIEENLADIEKSILSPRTYSDATPVWSTRKIEDKEVIKRFGGENCDNVYMLTDTIWSCCAYAMMYGNDSIEFETVNRYKYKISQNPNKGCTVEFNGPINGLLHQNILPDMTYEEGTLVGKFVDSQTNADLTPYMNMNDYGKLRAIKNNKASDYYEEGEINPQDGYGYAINKKFNNEIPFLSKSYDVQKAQENSSTEEKIELAWQRLENKRKYLENETEKEIAGYEETRKERKEEVEKTTLDTVVEQRMQNRRISKL